LIYTVLTNTAQKNETLYIRDTNESVRQTASIRWHLNLRIKTSVAATN
jgi:hypothetical protein